MFIRNLTKRQFDATLNREGQSVYDYYTLEEYKVFFRRNLSSSVSTDKMKIYFTEETPIKKGSIITYKDSIYIVGTINYYESNIYCVAEITQCYTEVAAGTKLVPLAIMDTDISTDSGTVSIIDGNTTLYTQYNNDSKNIKINNFYNIFGRDYKVKNTYCIDGILFILLEIVVAQEGGINTVTYLGENTITEYTPIPMYYSLVNHGTEDIHYSNENIVGYSSSDVEIATINDKGILIPISDESVDITITYRVNSCLSDNSDVESTFTHTITINTSPEPPSPRYTCDVTHAGTDVINIGGGKKTFDISCYDEGSPTSILPGTWSYEATDGYGNPINNTTLISKLNIQDVDVDTKKIGIVSDSDTFDWIGGTFTVKYTITDGGYVGSDTMQISVL